MEDGWPVWSPDGSQIAYVSSDEGKDDYDIFVLDLDSGDTRNVTNDPGDDYAPSWSPDGSTLWCFYSTYRSCTEPCDQSQADVYTVPVGGGEPTLLSGPEFDDVDPVWSPDGTRLFFARAACCQFDIWSMDPDGTNRVRHTWTRRTDEGNISFSSAATLLRVRPESRRGVWHLDDGFDAGTTTRLSPRGQEAWSPDWL